VADLANDFAFLVASAKRFLALLSSGDTPTPRANQRGSALAEHVSETARGVVSRLEAVQHEFETAIDEDDRLEAIKQARLLAGYAHFMQRALPWLNDAVDSPLDLGALYFIDEMASVMIGERADAVPTGSDEYSTETWPFEPLFPELRLSVGAGPLPIILNLPAVENRSCLLLPLFGHELGHTAIRKHGLIDAALAPLRKDAAFQHRLNTARDELARIQGFSKRRARLIIEDRLEDWSEELICDQLAIQYSGPSFLLAFATYLIALGWNEPGPLHPPTTTRIAHLLHWLDDEAWSPLVDAKMPASMQWIRSAGAAPRRPGHGPVIYFLLDAIEQARPAISAAASTLLGDNVFEFADYNAVARQLDDLLADEVLPVQDPETTDPIDRRAILLAGWLSIYGQVGIDSPDSLCLALQQQDSQDFFMKALEMSAVLSNWRAL
jgi:hypothetical protein